MNERSINRKLYIGISVVLVIMSFAAMLKMILVGYSHDEEYQIVMAYRHVIGDRLFSTMWEPHQTSSFINAFLIYIFMKVTGGTAGVLVFLRLCGMLLHLGVSVIVYKTLIGFESFSANKFFAFILALIYYNSTVSMFAEAEYSNILYWAGTLLLVFLCRLCLGGEKNKCIYAVLSGVAMCVAVLAFPPMILSSPIVLLFVILMSEKKDRIKHTLLFAGCCISIGIVYSAIQIFQVGFDTFIQTIPRIIFSDNTHQIARNDYWAMKLPSAFFGSFKYLAASAVIIFAAYLVCRLPLFRKNTNVVALSAMLASFGATLYFWLVKGEGFESAQIFVTVGAYTIVLFTIKAENKRLKLFLIFADIYALFVLLTGYIFSNMEFIVKVPHIVFVSVISLVVIAVYMIGEKQDKALLSVLVISCMFFVFAKGFMLRSGSTGTKNNILGIENICRTGPAAGVLTDYMGAYIMDSNYSEWDAYVSEGDNVLIVSETLHSDVITSYMFKDVNVCHYAVNNPYTYTETLLEYWDLYPEKKPNIIIIDCWYGTAYIDESEWIMNYIEEDFGYTQVCDGNYLRYYIKK